MSSQGVLRRAHARDEQRTDQVEKHGPLAHRLVLPPEQDAETRVQVVFSGISDLTLLSYLWRLLPHSIQRLACLLPSCRPGEISVLPASSASLMLSPRSGSYKPRLTSNATSSTFLAHAAYLLPAS